MVVDNDGNGGQQLWWMTMAAYDDGLQDRAVEYDGEGQERAARDGGDSGVAMMTAVWPQWKTVAANNNSNGGGQQRRMTAADDNGTQDWVADYDGGGWEWAVNNNGIKHKGRRRRCCF